MTIVRHRSRTEMNSLQRQLNRMFNEALTPVTLTDFNKYSQVPAAELTETEEDLVLKLELPGMQVADINIEATAKSISISGERKFEVKGKTRTEFRYGKFQRVISLPVRIKNTEIKANYEHGILYLTLPKTEAEKNKVVKVNLEAPTE